MAMKIIPEVPVADIKITIDYLVNTLGFKLDHVAAGGEKAMLRYNEAALVLEAKTIEEPPSMPEKSINIHVRVENIEDIYIRALTRGAIISRYLENNGHKDKDGKVDRRFIVSLPDGFPLTFVEETQSD